MRNWHHAKLATNNNLNAESKLQKGVTEVAVFCYLVS